MTNVCDALEVMQAHPEVAGSPSAQWDSYNALLEVLKNRWGLRISSSAPLRYGVADAHRTLELAASSLERMDHLHEAAGVSSAEWRTRRAVLEKHRTDPKCANCHALFDPYGVALEQFDGIGAFRSAYKDGSPIDPSTQLLDGTQLSSLSELADFLTREPLFKQCIADNMFTYGMGRVLSEADRPYLESVVQSWAGGADVPST